MTLQEANVKAEGGGWDSSAYDVEQEYSFLLDPLFWQALGKSLGWKLTIRQEGIDDIFEDGTDWLIEWHRLIDHLAEGKSIETYFETL